MKTIAFLFIFTCLFTLAPVTAHEIVQLTDDIESIFLAPQWSPDGEKLVYVSSPGWHQANIWIMDSDGNNKTQITSGLTGFGFDYPWSSDGSKIFYSSIKYWIMPGSWTYDLNTEERKRIDRDFDKPVFSTDYLSAIYSVIFKKVYSGSSDGKSKITSLQWVNESKLFIVEDGGDTQKLWLIDSDGTNKSLLTILSGGNTRFLWQPEGNSIIYVSKDSGNYDIWIMDSDGSGKKQLTSTPEDEYAMGIAFSPDGSKIVYASRNTIDRTNLSSFEGFFTTVWTMDTDGTNKTKLILPNASIYFYPSWSPDGQKIAFERRSDVGRYDVVVIKADGSDSAILTADIRGGAFPKWSPKGDKIAFVSLKDEKTDISIIILDEKWRSAQSEAIASLPAIPQGNGKKSPGFTISLVMMAFLIALELQKITR
ncbi:MAG: PD40 domain-containing protein [Methanomethylovorans sp.]|nr:PD40 domain-containing protein [Methanomethylovorans sp.]